MRHWGKHEAVTTEDLAAKRVQSIGSAIYHHDRTDVEGPQVAACKGLPRDSHGQVGEAISIEVSGGKAVAEIVARCCCCSGQKIVLVPGLALHLSATLQRRSPINDVHFASL